VTQENGMTTITDEFMLAMLPKARRYCLCILRAGPNRDEPGADKIIWEHGRRNFALREDGRLPVICRVADGSGLAGIGIFDAPVEQVRALLDDDPAVRAGVLAYELHTCSSFPGECLPG
jgi:hypothetical protein